MKRTKIFLILLIVALIAFSRSANVIAATPPQPNYGTADVDGDTGEWNLADDFFADMYRAGKPDKKVESKLYLRYDCSTNTLYALVLAVDGVSVPVKPKGAFIKIENTSPPPENIKLVDGNSGDDGNPPDFAWVEKNNGSATGWEASATLSPGSYARLNVHTQVFDAGSSQTSAVEDRAIELEIICSPTVVTLASFSASVNEDSVVTLNWQTATETDNAGFNIYRSRLKDGNYKKLNDALIPSEGNEVEGSSYSYEDTPPASGTYYYKLEDVDYNETTTMHGPVKVRVKK